MDGFQWAGVAPRHFKIAAEGRHKLGLLLKEGGAGRRKIEWLAEAQSQQYCLESKMTFCTQLGSLLSQ